MNEALVEFYRCPERLVNLRLAGEPAPEPGYFLFGDRTVCYGRSSMGASPEIETPDLRDLSRHVTADGSTLRLPFDPSEAVDNLRLERYVANGYTGRRSLLSSMLIREIYYRFRPLLPIAVRKHAQRLSLRRWDKLRFPAWPVDTTVEQILERLLVMTMKAQNLDKIPFIWFWPDGKSACAMMTHDVETASGLSFCSSVMSLNDSYGIKSSFQIIPEARYSTSQEILESIRVRGFEVNVHDWNHDGFLFSKRETFLTRAAKINQFAAGCGAEGFRSAVLYRNADWYHSFSFSYDMSMPNVGHLDPQRGGCCTVLPYFIGKIVELPLTTTQDYSLFHILGNYSIDLWKKQISLIMRRHGLASFNVHPDYIMKEQALHVYRALLGHLADLQKERNLWIALPRDVNRWWRDRSQMRLVPEGSRWRIEGPGQERARIAHAMLDGNRITYDVR
jgi:hypothetical protein